MAYLYGPVEGEAILAVKAWSDIKDVKVTLPESFEPVEGGTDVAKTLSDLSIMVQAGIHARFYALRKK
jgi:hypothetical protein